MKIENHRCNKRQHDEAVEEEDNRSRAKRPLPVCLNPDCGGILYVRDSPYAVEERKVTLVKEFKKERKRSRGSKKNETNSTKGKINRIGADRIDCDNSLFSAFFCNSAVEVVVMADQGLDVNLSPSAILRQIKEPARALQLTELNPPHVYMRIAKNGDAIRCTHEVA
ncbi:unnamed protein product [Agarophyton chilense]